MDPQNQPVEETPVVDPAVDPVVGTTPDGEVPTPVADSSSEDVKPEEIPAD